jgi:hypothetical protein
VISAWDIYWVMQLDTIGGAAAFAAFLGLMLTMFAWAAWVDKGIRTPITLPVIVTVLWLPIVAAAIFIPSTKTAAMMVVVPRIANNEAIQREAGDLYGIAKDALRELAKPKQEAAK